MADAPLWVAIVTPAITAVATGATTWITAKFEVLAFKELKQYEGIWYAYYRDPDSKECQEELWTFSALGNVTVSRNGKTTFKGKLSLRGNKAYMNVSSTISRDERLFVMLDRPVDPRGDLKPSVCVWLGKSANYTTTAGHGLLSRQKLTNPPIKDEFVRAAPWSSGATVNS